MLQKGFTFDEKLFFCQNPLKPKRLDVGVFTRTRINNNDDIVGEKKEEKNYNRNNLQSCNCGLNPITDQQIPHTEGMVCHWNFITDNFGLVQE